MAFPTNVSMQTTTSSAIAFQLITYYEKVGLERLLPKLRYAQFADKKPLPKGSGKTVQWYRFRTRAAVTTNLTEMVVPSLASLSADTLTATLFQRGSYVALSDLVTMTSINPILKTAAAQMGEEAARSVDTYIKDVITPHIANAGAASAISFTKIYGDTAPATGDGVRIWSGFSQDATAGGWRIGFPVLHNKTRLAQSSEVISAASTGLSVRSILHAAHWLRANNAPTFDDGNYVGIIHPNISYQVMAGNSTDGSAWKSWHQYTTPEAMYRGEIGQIGGVRFVETTEAPSFAMSGDLMTTAVSGSVYFTTILGKHAYGITEIDGGFKVFVNEAGSAGAADPLHQVNTIGWKVTLACAVLNKSAGCHIMSNSTDSFGC